MRLPEVGQSIENHSPVVVTGSENAITMFAVVATFVARSAGVVLLTVGGTSATDVKVWPVLQSPIELVAGAFHANAAYVLPVPVRRSDWPAVSFPVSATPMSVDGIPFAGP